MLPGQNSCPHCCRLVTVLLPQPGCCWVIQLPHSWVCLPEEAGKATAENASCRPTTTLQCFISYRWSGISFLDSPGLVSAHQSILVSWQGFMKVLIHHLRCGNLLCSKRLKRSYLWQ